MELGPRYWGTDPKMVHKSVEGVSCSVGERWPRLCLQSLRPGRA